MRLALLTSAAQLFFKRPPECQKVLGKILSAGMSDTNQDVHDRALLYYRCVHIPCLLCSVVLLYRRSGPEVAGLLIDDVQQG